MFQAKIIGLVITLLLAQSRFINSQPSIGDVQTYANFANDAIGAIKGDLPPEVFLLGSTGAALDNVLASIANVAGQITEISGILQQKMDVVLDTILDRIETEGKLQPAVRSLHTTLVRVDNLYQRFQYYSNNSSDINEYTIRNFARSITSNSEGDLPDVLDQLHGLIVPGKYSTYTESVVKLIGNHMRVSR